MTALLSTKLTLSLLGRRVNGFVRIDDNTANITADLGGVIPNAETLSMIADDGNGGLSYKGIAVGGSALNIDLTADRNVYVSTAGSDTAGDGSVGNPYATITKAVETIPYTHLNGFAFNVWLADGTYTVTGNITIPPVKSYGLDTNYITVQSVSGNKAACVVQNTTTAHSLFPLKSRCSLRNLTLKAKSVIVQLSHSRHSGAFPALYNCDVQVESYGTYVYGLFPSVSLSGMTFRAINNNPGAAFWCFGGNMAVNYTLDWNGFSPTNTEKYASNQGIIESY